MPFYVPILIIFAGVAFWIVLGARQLFLFLGGLGLRDSVNTIVPVAFLFIVRLFFCFFPGELSFPIRLLIYLTCFKVPHDNECYQSLVSNSFICDRAHLLAASDSAGCSSAWLNAIHNPSLSLAMPVTEFVVAVRIWLGISLFPTAQLCTCLSSIDSYGDHFLGFSYGPLRICRHDALTCILFHSMLLDNPRVLCEQRVSGDYQS